MDFYFLSIGFLTSLKETLLLLITYVFCFLLCVSHSIFLWEFVSLQHSPVFAKRSIYLICKNKVYVKFLYSFSFYPFCNTRDLEDWLSPLFLHTSHLHETLLDKLLTKVANVQLGEMSQLWKYLYIVFLEQIAFPCFKMCSDFINDFNSFT